jgi:hypothetical protein
VVIAIIPQDFAGGLSGYSLERRRGLQPFPEVRKDGEVAGGIQGTDCPFMRDPAGSVMLKPAETNGEGVSKH